MQTIEVKATFKNINIKDKTVLQFELSPYCMNELPDLTKLANTNVMLTIESEQQELPIEDAVLDVEYEQPAIPIDDAVEEPMEVEVLELPAPGLPEEPERYTNGDTENRGE